MINPDDVPPVVDHELLARFILNSNEFRADKSVTAKLFMPYKHVTLSVTRHRDATHAEIWAIGRGVADERAKTLYGRADITASLCRIRPLDVVPAPLPENPNHADITGFPEQKEDQKSVAQKLAAAASPRIEPPADAEWDAE